MRSAPQSREPAPASQSTPTSARVIPTAVRTLAQPERDRKRDGEDRDRDAEERGAEGAREAKTHQKERLVEDDPEERHPGDLRVLAGGQRLQPSGRPRKQLKEDGRGE